MMTLDRRRNGAYFGTIAAVSGTGITLASDPVFHDYAPQAAHQLGWCRRADSRRQRRGNNIAS